MQMTVILILVILNLAELGARFLIETESKAGTQDGDKRAKLFLVKSESKDGLIYPH